MYNVKVTIEGNTFEGYVEYLSIGYDSFEIALSDNVTLQINDVSAIDELLVKNTDKEK